MNVFRCYLHSLLTATEQTSISELQGLFSTGTLLPFNLQTAKVAFIDGQRLKSLFWTQVTLREQSVRHVFLSFLFVCFCDKAMTLYYINNLN